ncbi:MAG: hypothetical protein Q8K65_10860 [Alphaproteobacteria bacterium]|nr:hypothetical protein [Alphaproteobacteria bacterium]
MSIQDEIRAADHKIGKDVSHFDSGLSAEVSRLKTDAKHLTRDGKAIINDGAHVTADYIRELTESLKKSGRRTLEKTEAHIQDKPGQSIAIAFAAGMVASLLFGRRGG